MRLPGSLSLSVDNFRVEELPRYEPSGEGEHVYALVEKVGMSTLNCVDRCAEALGVRAQDVGYAGLKDRHAVTLQWLSFAGAEPDAVQALDIEGMRVHRVSRHTNKLKMGHLRGNRFQIAIDLPEDRLPQLRSAVDSLERSGVPNYFGAQRFGSGGRNLQKGLDLLRADNPRGAARRFRKGVLRILLSSVQSEAFNRVLAQRVLEPERWGGFGELRRGDVAYLHANGACFAVEDVATDRLRAQRFEISPTGPLVGPKCRVAGEGEARELEAAVLAELDLQPELFAPFKSHPGERRPLRLRLLQPEVEAKPGGAWLRFGLDRGAFATTVLRELFADPPWVEDERPAIR